MVVGLVTLEDVLEELIAHELFDETDAPEGSIKIRMIKRAE